MATELLTDDDRKIISEEEKIFETIMASLQASDSSHGDDKKILDRMQELRELAAQANERDLPHLLSELHAQKSLYDHKRSVHSFDMDLPYFARLELEEGGKTRNILLGHHTFLETANLPIINWKHAPLAKIFFRYAEGDNYHEELPNKTVEGVVKKRRLISIENGVLVGITTKTRTFMKSKQGAWTASDPGTPTLRGGERTAERGQLLVSFEKSNMNITGLLDSSQYEILTASPDETLLILGGAGSGKTTVALHRLSYLVYKDPSRFRQNSILVVVPEHGLALLIKKLLAALKLPLVRVLEFDEWIRLENKNLNKNVRVKFCDWTPAKVSYLKRHPAVKNILPAFLEKKMEEIANKLAVKFPAIPSMFDALKNGKGRYLERINAVRKAHVSSIAAGSSARPPLEKLYSDLTAEFLDSSHDPSAIFGSEEILNEIAKGSAQLTEQHLKDTLRHINAQREATTKQKLAGIDEDRLKSSDETSVLEEDEIAGTTDVEDLAVMFLLSILKHGSHQKTTELSSYEHLVVDETQDISPLELSCLSEVMSDNASHTIAGDSVQKTDETAYFSSWNTVLKIFDPNETATHELSTNYRCTKEIYDMGQKVLGPLVHAQPMKSIKSGPPVTITEFPSEGHFCTLISETLQNLMEREPNATVAVIAQNIENAARFYSNMSELPKCRLVENGEFSFLPGIDFTDVDQVKGLEFDYVIVPDASSAFYPNTPLSRRRLHVAVTRAIFQLWIVSIGRKSPLLT
ncbi:MAG: UvrD-helicase domain-containing protein [Oligoflexales bacterium]